MSLPKPYVPIETDALTRAFPASVGHMMPALDDLHEAKREWTEIVDYWFGQGLAPNAEFHAVPGIDAEVAFHHLSSIMRSFEPKHEHKIAAVAILMEAWFESITGYQFTPEEIAIRRGETMGRIK